jgi:hypothetical protein
VLTNLLEFYRPTEAQYYSSDFELSNGAASEPASDTPVFGGSHFSNRARGGGGGAASQRPVVRLGMPGNKSAPGGKHMFTVGHVFVQNDFPNSDSYTDFNLAIVSASKFRF